MSANDPKRTSGLISVWGWFLVAAQSQSAKL
jgi:hypothetical protein